MTLAHKLRWSGGIIFVAVIAAAIVWLSANGNTTTDAYVTGHDHPISARVIGTVIDVRVDDNQHVQAGQVLVVLDPADYEVQAQLANAQIAQAKAQLAAAVAQAAQAQAQITGTQATYDRAQSDFTRADELIGQTPRGISRQEYDAARATRDATSAAHDSAKAQLAAADAAEDIARAQIETGQANLRNADLALSYTKIVAPVSGYVGRKTVEVGARVNAGQTLLFVVSDDIWVVANYKETQLAGIAPHAPVDIWIDALKGHQLAGYVDSIAPGTGQEFALLPPDNATGNFTKVVQRVPVKIRFDPSELQEFRDRLVPGLSVETRVKLAVGK
jgi:membrane fusion protein, multidrug efflux system